MNESLSGRIYGNHTLFLLSNTKTVTESWSWIPLKKSEDWHLWRRQTHNQWILFQLFPSVSNSVSMPGQVLFSLPSHSSGSIRGSCCTVKSSKDVLLLTMIISPKYLSKKQLEDTSTCLLYTSIIVHLNFLYFLPSLPPLPPLPLFSPELQCWKKSLPYIQFLLPSGMDSVYTNGLYGLPPLSVSPSFRPHVISSVYTGLWGLMFGQPHPSSLSSSLPSSPFYEKWEGSSGCLNSEFKTENWTYRTEPPMADRACFSSAPLFFLPSKQNKRRKGEWRYVMIGEERRWGDMRRNFLCVPDSCYI